MVTYCKLSKPYKYNFFFLFKMASLKNLNCKVKDQHLQCILTFRELHQL